MTEYEARLATRITPEARRRLKLAAAVTGQSISAILTRVLDTGLPSADELADQLRTAPKGDAPDDVAR